MTMTHSAPVEKRDLVRRIFTWLALTVALLFLLFQLSRYARQAPLVIGDFVEYWSAGRLCLQGDDPYDLAQLDVVQRSAGSTKPRSLLMHNPPWMLSIVLPFALLDYNVGVLTWILFLLAGLVVSTDLIWQSYEYPSSRRWIAWVLGALFVPSMFALNIGQISPLLLLGLSIFLYCAKRERWGWAGLALILVTAKPQLLYLFWIALALWALTRRKWRLVVGGLAGLLLTLIVPLLLRPHLLSDYVRATLAHPPKRWMTPTWGAVLRLQFGWQRMWLQFIPPLLGVGWLIHAWRRCRKTWIWREQLPALLFASLLTTAYGWSHDQVVLLIPVIQAVGSLVFRRAGAFPWVMAGGYVLINALALGIHVLKLGEFWFIWMAPAWLGWYMLVQGWAARQTSPLEAGA